MSSATYEGPGKTARIMIWAGGAPKQVECTWGLKPVDACSKPVSLLRWEGREISNPCLIVANDFGLRVNGRFKYRASLIADAPFFCLAGTWRPAKTDWPAAYAAFTTAADPDIAPYKDRHVAVVREDDWLDWLQQSKPVSEILRPFPPGSFSVSGTGKAVAVGDLFDFS